MTIDAWIVLGVSVVTMGVVIVSRIIEVMRYHRQTGGRR